MTFCTFYTFWIKYLIYPIYNIYFIVTLGVKYPIYKLCVDIQHFYYTYHGNTLNLIYFAFLNNIHIFQEIFVVHWHALYFLWVVNVCMKIHGYHLLFILYNFVTCIFIIC